MHHRVAIALTLAAALSAAGRELTLAPVFYMLDYGGNHLDRPEYIEWVRDLPPDLLHFGKDVPMTHLFGPIQAVGGENQAHGRRREDIRRLTPAQVRERMAALQRLNRDLHAAGVRWVMPYIAAITMAGDPAKREGFFEFYDHWDEYAEYGIGPRPGSSPESWAAIKADGSLHTFGKDLAPAYYAGMNRYVNCIEHPDWRAWLQQVTRLCAVAGYDGVFPDNSSPIQCHAPCCQRAFAEFLAAKYPPAELQELFGTADATGIALPKDRGDLVYVEAQRFYQTSLARHLHDLREAGRTVNPQFQMFPNCGTPIHSAEYLLGHADFLMQEGGSGQAEGAGCVVTPIIGDIRRRAIEDNILEYRYVAGLPGHIGLLLLEMGPTPWTRQLCIAEAAAFGSGAYNGVRPSSREVQRPYIEFVRRYRDLYDGKRSAAQVGLLFFPMQAHYPGNRHWTYAFELKDRLGSLQIPFDCFSEGGVTAPRLETYRALLAPDLRYLSAAHLGALREYVAAGGTLIVLDRFGSDDLAMRPRPRPEWLPAAGHTQPCGQGQVVVCELIPSRTELARLLASAGVRRLVAGEAHEVTYPLLRTMLYEGAGEWVLHLLNYSAPVDNRGGPPVPLSDVQVALPLPIGTPVVKVSGLAPGVEVRELPFTVRDGVCEFTVPTVDLYTLCRVEVR